MQEALVKKKGKKKKKKTNKERGKTLKRKMQSKCYLRVMLITLSSFHKMFLNVNVGSKRLIGSFQYLHWARGPAHGKTPPRPWENLPWMDIAEDKKGNRPPVTRLQIVPQGRESTKVEKDNR